MAQNYDYGGELYYDYMGNENYEVTLKLFWECDTDYSGFNPVVEMKRVSDTTIFYYPLEFDSQTIFQDGYVQPPCVQPMDSICLFQITFSTIAIIPPTPGGYELSYHTAPKNLLIENFNNPQNYLGVYSCVIPDSGTYNNSARFDDLPPAFMCIDELSTYQFSIIDADQDSVVYFLCDPEVKLIGYPDSTVGTPWALGYDAIRPLPSATGFTLDALGLSGMPNRTGVFSYAVCYQEYRDGVLINEGARELTAIIVDCEDRPQLLAEAVLQLDDLYQCLGASEFNFVIDSILMPGYGTFYFDWDFGDGQTSSIMNPVHSYTDTGTYPVEVVVYTDGHPECDDNETIVLDTVVYVLEAPIPYFFINQDTQCITDQNFSFYLDSSGLTDFTYQWELGTTASIPSYVGDSVVGITFNSAGNHLVIMMASNQGCTRRDSAYATVFSLLEPTFIADSAGCAPLMVEFTNSSDAKTDVDWYWDFGDGWQSIEENPVHTYKDTGQWSVRLAGLVEDVCPGFFDTTYVDAIEVYPNPNVTFQVEQPVKEYFDKTIEVTIDDSGGDLLYLDYGDGTGLTTELMHTYNTSGDYFITVVMMNDYICFDTSSIWYFVKPKLSFYSPNSFTPNGDRINDVFLQKGTDIDQGVSLYELQIFTRWGEMIYSTNDIHQGWDGYTSRGKKADMGVYSYKTTIVDFYGIYHEYLGSVSLLE